METVELWRVGSPGDTETRKEELVTPMTFFYETLGSVVGIVPHPTDKSVLAT